MREVGKKFCEMLSRNVDEINLSELAETIDKMVNVFGFDVESLANAAPTNAVPLSVAWVRFWSAQPEWRFDGRNEIAGRICRQFVSMDAFSALESNQDELALQTFATLMTVPYTRSGETLQTMHRTLMQTFSGFVFCVLERQLKLDNGWSHLPLI